MVNDELVELEAAIKAEEAIKALPVNSPSAQKKCVVCGKVIELNEPYTVCTQHSTYGCSGCSDYGYLPDKDAKYKKYPCCPSYLIHRRSDLTCIWLRK